MVLEGAVLQDIQQGLVILIYENDCPLTGLAVCFNQQILEAFAQGFALSVQIPFLFPSAEVDVQSCFQSTFDLIILAVKIEIKNRVRLPGSFGFFFIFREGQTLEKVFFSFPVGAHGGQQEAFAESARSAEKVFLACMGKAVDKHGFVDVKVLIPAQTLEALNADWKFVFHICLVCHMCLPGTSSGC